MLVCRNKLINAAYVLVRDALRCKWRRHLNNIWVCLFYVPLGASLYRL